MNSEAGQIRRATLEGAGTGDPDPHVPFARMQETQAVLTRLGAAVDLRRYPGLPYTINQDEMPACQELLRRLVDVGE